MCARASAWTTRTTVALAILAAASGCDSIGGLFGSSGLSGQTTLKSTTLSGNESSTSAVPAPWVVLGDDGLEVTPDNVTGEVLSLLFATAGQDDEGIVIFGDGRPDIAPADSDLYDFDLDAPEPINSTISLQPGFVGGTSTHMVLLFGFMDMHITLGGSEKVVRVAMADVDDMQRGDKLLLDDATNTFRWYDLDTSAFATTRPSNPAAIEEIRDFTDPIRPNLVFYPINVNLLTPVSVDATELAAASSMDVVLDFVMTSAILLEDQINQNTVTDADLITSFDLFQNTSGFGESGFQVDAEVELTP